MSKRAVIYVRTSSEHQGEKSSPDEQEMDCRKLAEANGYTVVKVYRDTERYRSKSRLVDPSGTRVDRPKWIEMFRDGASGLFDIVLAWREDRLYRGMRAMLMFLEFIQDNKVGVALARESFDPKMAPIKAWVAGMELDGMRERMTMGVKARLRAGKANTGQDRYGYKRKGEVIEELPEESIWVRRIFEWYVAGEKLLDIRQRLIEANAPQKGSTRPRRIHWALSSIQGVLIGAKTYATGIKIQTRAGEAFEIQCPPLISQELYEKYMAMRRANKTYPARNVVHPYLLGGLITCSCERVWWARVNSYTRRNRRGIKEPRKSLYGVYFCPQRYVEHIHTDCPRTIGCKLADNDVWQRVRDTIKNPDILIAGARRSIDQVIQSASEAQNDTDRIEKELEALQQERQWIITQGRKGKLTESDFDYQIGSLTAQEQSLRKELAEATKTIDLSIFNNWEDRVREYFSDLEAGLDSLDAEPEEHEALAEIYAARRRVIKNVVEKVVISKDRNLRIVYKLNILNMVSEQIQGRVSPGSAPAAGQVLPAQPSPQFRDTKSGGI